MTRIFLLAALACAACSQAPAPVKRDYFAARADDHGASGDLAGREMIARRRLPIISDDGEKLGLVRKYTLDRSGRIVSAAPSNPRLEPADAPERAPVA